MPRGAPKEDQIKSGRESVWTDALSREPWCVFGSLPLQGVGNISRSMEGRGGGGRRCKKRGILLDQTTRQPDNLKNKKGLHMRRGKGKGMPLLKSSRLTNRRAYTRPVQTLFYLEVVWLSGCLVVVCPSVTRWEGSPCIISPRFTVSRHRPHRPDDANLPLDVISTCEPHILC